ncbi:diguanylate cyclase/phosphodiesterase (GGDEF & EAL domains) with PAS/PAC sensor(s) [Alloactinosynnema sp. L-07]|uniref:putative bifunctional diguanylate cyclase/phosphodiesterase n=1 Tax=Alloactinosynnema sp. L-07 TaxID=1653480 RepID=UPI00065EFBF9|nr:EAL domain-containing protein [Alloactinosynnema sp. L-07]CRK58261.1 diguanylate cyclase/phosphodiesterase (GGDEF & EAL domains) with PAS/PAC sensor(s) [Alloactinosynnema sp. L-07]
MNRPLERDDHSPPDDGARERLILTRKWAYLLSDVGFVRISREALERELAAMVDALCADVRDPNDTGRARAAGARLVELEVIGEGTLERTVEVLSRGLSALPGLAGERIALCVGALACGFAAANRDRTLLQQDNIKLSLLKAVRDAKWHLRESEARFDGVATASANGIVITDLDGVIVRVNGAIGEIVGHAADELTGQDFFAIVHPDFAPILRADYAALLAGKRLRIKQSQQLLRADGDVARVTLTASLLRGGDGGPRQFVTVVEDGTELMLLQSELSRQALHDVLTGLPNRQFFDSRLEGALQRADPRHGITLIHLGLDAVAAVGNSLGRRAADRLLTMTAQRLSAVVFAEKSMVAKFEGDEFAILLENSATTPDVAATVSALTAELAEVTYVDSVGVAAPACFGVVHRPHPDLGPAEVLRAADVALRRAQRSGPGQWELYDVDQDAEDRSAYALAAAMPGAWETGELTVRYRPLVRLADGATAGVEAGLWWDHPDLGPLPHERCLALAEQTGLVLSMGAWALGTAAIRVRWWPGRRAGRPLLVGLTAHQSADADLVARVRAALHESGLRPEDLLLGMPTHVVAADRGESVANLSGLSDIGVSLFLDGFGASPGDLALVEDHPVHAVRVARTLVARQARSPDSPVSVALAALPSLVHDAGVKVIVDGVGTPAQAQWWRAAGADLALGDHFGRSATDLPQLTRPSDP